MPRSKEISKTNMAVYFSRAVAQDDIRKLKNKSSNLVEVFFPVCTVY